MQYVTFPMKILRFSAIWNTSTPHKKCSGGSPKDYPTDLVGADTGKDWFYAPCDLICLKVYNRASHGLWFRSTEKVKMPIGEGYFYMMAEHESVSGFKVGKTYKKGAKLFTENRYGNATGNHIHLSCGWSKEKHSGGYWTKNSRGAWVLRISGVTNIKIYEAMYVDTDFTTIRDTRHTFKKVSGGGAVESTYTVGTTYTLQEDMNVRITYKASAPLVGVSKWTAAAQKYATSDGLLAKGTRVTCKDVYTNSANGETWLRIPSGWVCAVGSSGKVYIK